ncbi:MAG: putative zinc-binding metallopeptidase [Chloroflexi bacterium]|nr:putative zinc-binding metallopeptidase [Chloroflexota bacterium]
MVDQMDFGDISDVPDVTDSGQVDDALSDAFDQDITQVGATDISNFTESGLTDSNTVAAYITANIPAEHLEGLDSIEYVNDPAAYQDGLQGMWESDPWTGETGIDVFPHDSQNELFDTVAHEIGHNAEAVMLQQNPDMIDQWNDLYGASAATYNASGGEQNEFVSPYARTSPEEDFAESYATFINDPALLQAASPDKYDFMAENVFD